MSDKTTRARDAFTFSLRGLTTIAAYTAAPAIADDRLNELRDERPNRIRKDHRDTSNGIAAIRGRFWLLRRLRSG